MIRCPLIHDSMSPPAAVEHDAHQLSAFISLTGLPRAVLYMVRHLVTKWHFSTPLALRRGRCTRPDAFRVCRGQYAPLAPDMPPSPLKVLERFTALSSERCRGCVQHPPAGNAQRYRIRGPAVGQYREIVGLVYERRRKLHKARPNSTRRSHQPGGRRWIPSGTTVDRQRQAGSDDEGGTYLEENGRQAIMQEALSSSTYHLVHLMWHLLENEHILPL